MDTNMEEIDELIEFIPYSIGIELPDIITIILILTYLLIIKKKDKILSFYKVKKTKNIDH